MTEIETFEIPLAVGVYRCGGCGRNWVASVAADGDGNGWRWCCGRKFRFVGRKERERC